ncbi:MAG TPA: dTDP-4-dehydrorhamnose reductase [Paludibacter sp.]|nr:dTDP-4-dehydrorhamnose reductase [Paludibacter sp.]HPM08906.1 dTDP-4-dehydrorhamnose reductase [Paludibacter sp.]
MKILLIGKNGQVGWELSHTLLTHGEIIEVDYPQIDLADHISIRELIGNVKPDVIVNAAAYTNVDKAESKPEIAMKVNGIAPAVIAEEAQKLHSAFIHFSTDYVFDGLKNSPYVETDTPNPINVYGVTKLEGENAIKQIGGSYLIFRTSWVFSLRQGGFVAKILQWARKNKKLYIVDDQIGCPTWSRLLAQSVSHVLAQGNCNPIEYLMEKSGLYHLAGGGFCNRFEWAKTILDLDPNKSEQITEAVIPGKSIDFQTAAMRPSNSSLNCDRVKDSFNLSIPNWQLLMKSLFN